MPRTPKLTKEERANMTHDELLRSVWLLDEVIESLRWIPVSERLPNYFFHECKHSCPEDYETVNTCEGKHQV